MSQPEVSPCCPPGSHGAPVLKNNETPRGILIELGPNKTSCYYTAPTKTTQLSSSGISSTTSSSSNLGIIVYTDVYGFQSRIRIICDYLAQHGNYHVICPDCFHGETKADHTDDFLQWLQTTPYHPIVAQDTDACIEYLKQKVNVNAGMHPEALKLGTIGFCWGAWAIGKSSAAGIPWKVAVAPHPSFRIESAAFDGDEIGLMKQISCPLLLLPAENDAEYTKPGSPDLEEIVKRGGKSILFADMKHGWTTRGDMADENVERDVHRALDEMLDFLLLHLKE